MAPAQIVFYLVATLISAIGIFIQIHRRRLVKHVEKLNPIPLALIPKLLTLNFDSKKDYLVNILQITTDQIHMFQIQLILCVQSRIRFHYADG